MSVGWVLHPTVPPEELCPTPAWFQHEAKTSGCSASSLCTLPLDGWEDSEYPGALTLEKDMLPPGVASTTLRFPDQATWLPLPSACSEYPHPVGGKELLLISLGPSPVLDHSPGQVAFCVATWIGIRECSVTLAVSPWCWGTEARVPRTPWL